MAHDVFISHSAKDKVTADAVCAMLESEGIRCWIAPRDVVPGMEWGKCIIEAIRGARIMVLVFTANANASPQIRREVERAVHRNVIILPFRVENVVPDESLEYFIGNVHWLDALTPPLEAHLKNLVRTIKALVTPTPELQIPSNAEPAASQPEIIGASRPGGRNAGAGTPPGFRMWGTQAWTWASGAASVLLLATVFVVVHSNSRPAQPGSAPSPVVSGSAPPPLSAANQASPTGGTGGEPARHVPSPVVEPPQPARPVHSSTGAPATTSPPRAASPATEFVADEQQARNLVQAKRYNEAGPLAQKACAGGVMNGCNILGLLYGNGWGVPRNYAEARSLYQTACDGGELSGCGNLGYLYVRGLGVPQDVAKGTSLLQEACNSGRQWSCEQLKNLQR